VNSELVGHEGANGFPEGMNRVAILLVDAAILREIHGGTSSLLSRLKRRDCVNGSAQRGQLCMSIAFVRFRVRVTDDFHTHFLRYPTIEHAAIERVPETVE